MHRKYSVFLCYGRCDMSNKVAGIRLGAAGAGGGGVRQHVHYLNCLYHEAVRCVPSPRQLAGRRVANFVCVSCSPSKLFEKSISACQIWLNILILRRIK